MNKKNSERITVQTIVKAPAAKVWEVWTAPHHIKNWNTASEEWHTTKVDNNPVPGGGFSWRMEAKDGSFCFDFEGVYKEVIPYHTIRYNLADGRNVVVQFKEAGTETVITETFEPENENDVALQKMGWQAILNNFKKYTEGL